MTRRGLLASMGCAGVAALAGCRHGAWLGYALMGPPKVPAMYTPINQTTVVMIDDPRHVLSSVPLMGVIAASAAHELKKNKIIDAFIEPNRIDELRMNQKDFSNWPVDKVGEAVGARQVLYVLIEEFAPGSRENATLRPTAVARVKIVEVETGKRLFPTNDSLGHRFSSSLFYKDMENATRGQETVVSRELAQRLGEDIAFLFYEHEQRNELAPTREYQ